MDRSHEVIFEGDRLVISESIRAFSKHAKSVKFKKIYNNQPKFYLSCQDLHIKSSKFLYKIQKIIKFKSGEVNSST